MTARRNFNGCFSDSIAISPTAIVNPQAYIVGDTTPCADAGVREIYQVVCGTMNPCMAGQNYVWSIDPAFGSIVSGQNSSTIEVEWHIPASGIPNTAVQVSYELCGQPYTASLPIILQFPTEVTVSGTSVGCAGDVFSFSASSNSNLTVASVEWTIVDQIGQTYTEVFTGPPATTLNANTAILQPEIAAGFARVTARVTYSNGCTIEDVGSHDFEVLFNPQPQVSTLAGEACDEKGNPMPTEVSFITSTSGGASDVFFVWERVCSGNGGADVIDTVASGLGVGSINVLVSPDDGCCYRVRTLRDYVRKGQHYACERVSACEVFIWNCDANCGGYCPEVVLIDNTAPAGPMPTCGRVDVRANTFDCDGNAINLQVEEPTFGSWTVSPTPNPALTRGPISSTDFRQIDRFSNVVVPFETFTKPLVYSISYYLEKDNATPEPKCGGDAELVEITLVPHLGYKAYCSATDTGVYELQLQDGTDVIDQAVVNNYAWRISDISGLLVQSSLANDFVNIPARAQSYEIEICLQPTANQVWVNPGTPYSCQVCETMTIPGRPISTFSVAEGAVCAGTAFQFTYTNPQDPDSEFFWDFGDSTYSYQANPSKVYATTGTFTVSLTHTNSLGCTATSFIEVVSNPANLAGEIEVELNEPCGVTATVAFIRDAVMNGVPDYTYDWSPVVAGDDAMAIEVVASGVYSVSVVDGNGCRYDAAPVGVNLNEAFYEEIQVESPQCYSDNLSVFFSFAGSNDFTYRYFVDGISRGAANANTDNSFQQSLIGPGVHTIDIVARNVNQFGQIRTCDTLTATFELLSPSAAPEIELVEVNCDPNWSVTYRTVDGSVVTWYDAGRTLGIGSTLTVFSSSGGGIVRARRSGVACLSPYSNTLSIPQSPEANIVTGCYGDCDDRPLLLEELSGSSYAFWEWIFIPVGSSNPVNCMAPGPGTGQVTPWPNYYDDCGNGTYMLRTAQILPNGDTCFSETNDLCTIICPDTLPCNGPTWIPENMVCQASPIPGYELYYVNFHAYYATGDPVVLPCVDGITVVGGDFFSDLYLTIEGDNAFNLETTLLIESGALLDSVCITVPYVQAGDACSPTNYCVEEEFCLGDVTIASVDDCDREPCTALPSIGSVTFDCPGDQGNSAVVRVTIEDVVFQVPAGCEGFRAQVFGGTGDDSDLDPGGERWDLDGVFNTSGTTFTVDEIGYDLIVHQGARLACIRFGISCWDEDISCSSSICYELPTNCTPDDLPAFAPEVACEGESDGLEFYSAYIPFGEAAPKGEEGWTVISSTFGASSELKFTGESSASITISAPEGLVGTWVLFGDPGLERKEFVVTGTSKDDSYSLLLPTDGDVIRYIWFPDCNGLQARSVWSTEASSRSAPLTAMLSVAPNPAADRLTITSVLPESSSLNWESLRLVGVDGRQYSAASLVQTDDRAELLLVDLPPGWYSVSILTDAGEPLHAYFIKQ